MPNWTRTLGLAAISCVAMSANAQTQDPPLLSFFKAFCAVTKGDEVAIKKAIEAAGGEVTILPDDDASPTEIREFAKLKWQRGEISLQAQTIHYPAFPKKGKPRGRNVVTCNVFDRSHDIAGAEAVRKWIGVPASKTWPGVVGSQMYTYTYQESGGTKSSVPWERFFDTDNIWMIDVDLGSGAVMMFHNTVLPPALN